ncbi:MAG TPA: PrgI family protein [Candidatus Paceibacterota bacterium]|nr:PrgI family protein [Candidatus Paceibacterota bacterium]
MRYQVPQFIEVEDKIFGPLTFKQFLYLAGGAGLSYIFFRYLPLYVAVLPILGSLGLGIALAFYKVNNRPFILLMESAFNYAISHKLYIWKKEERKPEEKKEESAAVSSIYVPKLSESKLKDLTWSLDINDTLYSQETRKKRDEDLGLRI